MMLHSLRNMLRLLRIGLVMRREGALFALRSIGVPLFLLFPLYIVPPKRSRLRRGENLRRALERLGPSFIKLGQALSTRADMVGEELAADLASLRDRLPPFPSPIARRIVENELRAPIASLFTAFDDEPAAAASIAQVHFAYTKEGDAVAVKILRPGIEKAFARDLELFTWLAGIVERRVKQALRLKPRAVIDVLRHSVSLELDLRFEASSASLLKKNLLNDPAMHIPAVHWPLSTRRVLVTERVHGIPIHDAAALDAVGHDKKKLVEILAESFFNQAFRDGFFHADLHPGNVMVEPGGAIALVDFGIMGRLDKKNRLYVAEILHGFLSGDFNRVADVHFDAGYVPAHRSREEFALACRAIGEPLLAKPLSEISIGRLLAQLFCITEMFEMETQPQLLLLQKTLVMVEGMGRTLCAEANMWEMAGPLIARWAQEHMGMKAKIQSAAEDFVACLRTLPGLLKEIEIALRNRNKAA